MDLAVIDGVEIQPFGVNSQSDGEFLQAVEFGVGDGEAQLESGRVELLTLLDGAVDLIAIGKCRVCGEIVDHFTESLVFGLRREPRDALRGQQSG